MVSQVSDEMQSAVHAAVPPIWRRYRRYLDSPKDLEQEMWTWVYGNPERAQELLDGGFLTRRLRTVAERFARREKASRSGYRPEDEHFYSIRAIKEILPYALNPAATAPQQTQDVRVATSREGFSGWEAGLADVRAALATLPAGELALLRGRYLLGLAPDELARAMGADTADTARLYGRVGRVVRRLQRALGGPPPAVL